jgi:hypothetical protein
MRKPDHATDVTSPAWLRSRAAATAGFLLIFMLTALYLAQSAMLIVLWRFATDGPLMILWLLAGYSVGGAILRISRVPMAPPALRRVVAVALGLGTLSLLILCAGLIGWLNQWSAIVLLAAPTLVWLACQGRKLRRIEISGVRKPAGWNWLWLALAPLLAGASVAALVPPGVLWGDEPNGYDVVEYHLQGPREWYEAGRITPLTHNLFSYFPMNVEAHYLLAMELRGGPWQGMYLAQFMHVAFIALAIVAIYASVQHRGGIAVIAAVIAGAAPWTWLLAPVAYNEGGLLLWGTLAIGLTLRAIDCEGSAGPPSRPALFLLAGVMTGFACGAKLTGVPTLLVSLPLAVLLSQGSRARFPAMARCCVILVLGGLAAMSPWLIRNIFWTYNPVFPEATGLLGKAHLSDAQIQRWRTANHEPAARLRSISGRFDQAWQQIIGDSRYAYAILPLAIICAILARHDIGARALIILLILLAAYWLFLTHLQSRFFVLSIPIAALLVGTMARKFWGIGACIAVVLACVSMAAFDSRFARYSAFGVLGVSDLVDLTPLGGRAIPESQQVVLIGDARAFWYPIPMRRLYYRTVFDVNAVDGESSVDAWKKGAPTGPGVLYVIDPSELLRFARTYYAIPAPPPDVAARDRPYVTP